MTTTRRFLAVLAVTLGLMAVATVAPPGAPAGPDEAAAHHSGRCDITSPKIQQQWGCAKHGRTSSTFGYIQLDDTHTNGRGLYAYAVFAGDSTKPGDWSLMALWGGDKRTFWVSRHYAIHWVAYCDGAKNYWGSNCDLKGW